MANKTINETVSGNVDESVSRTVKEKAVQRGTSGTKVIEISHVEKFYGKKHALKDVSLTIEQGMFGLLGRNGAGKTTLMKTLATLHGKQGGSISV